jgi:hypothetical protein
MRATRLAALGLALAALAGCGRGDGHDHADHAHDHPAAAPAGPPPTALTVTPARGLKIAASLEAACVKPGERQTLRVTGPPRVKVLFQAIYADGSYGLSKDYPGGNERGDIDPRGRFASSWTLGPAAAPGPVRMDVRYLGPGLAGEPVHLGFAVADAQGRCP